MYNEVIKGAFLSSFTESEARKTAARRVMMRLEPFERALGKDVAVMTRSELTDCVNRLSMVKKSATLDVVSILVRYSKWCEATGVPVDRDNIKDIIIDRTDAIRKRMVANPKHFNNYLDIVFSPVDEAKVDIVFRGFLWLAYMGLEEEDIYHVKASDVDYYTMVVTCRGVRHHIYPEALPTLRALSTLEELVYEHGGNPPKFRKRLEDPDNTLIRGFRPYKNTTAFLNNMSRQLSEKAEIAGRRMSYSTAWLSGYFYRLSETEPFVERLDMSEIVNRTMARHGKEYVGVSMERKRVLLARQYLEDYNMWKLAFEK